jgi:hypothetical protein
MSVICVYLLALIIVQNVVDGTNTKLGTPGTGNGSRIVYGRIKYIHIFSNNYGQMFAYYIFYPLHKIQSYFDGPTWLIADIKMYD